MNKDANRIITIGLGVILLLIIVRFAAPFRFLIFGLLTLAAVGLGGFFLIRYLIEWRKRRKFESSTEGMIHWRRDYCRRQLEVTQDKIGEIQDNIEELKGQLRSGKELSRSSREEIAKLLEEFKEQLALRRAKEVFFESCIGKLNGLLRHHQLAKTLENKRE
ncbi:MAG: hypothetical protein R3350_07860, partial [Saprospiraceae bacterium]|nr:hypothetical protein [Saprospiraceae bacterium]